MKTSLPKTTALDRLKATDAPAVRTAPKPPALGRMRGGDGNDEPPPEESEEKEQEEQGEKDEE